MSLSSNECRVTNLPIYLLSSVAAAVLVVLSLAILLVMSFLAIRHRKKRGINIHSGHNGPLISDMLPYCYIEFMP